MRRAAWAVWEGWGLRSLALAAKEVSEREASGVKNWEVSVWGGLAGSVWAVSAASAWEFEAG